jgi:WD40 repeat protein
VRLWDLATGRLLARLDEHVGPVTSLAFFPSGRRAVSAGFDQTLRIWYLPR